MAARSAHHPEVRRRRRAVLGDGRGRLERSKIPLSKWLGAAGAAAASQARGGGKRRKLLSYKRIQASPDVVQEDVARWSRLTDLPPGISHGMVWQDDRTSPPTVGLVGE